MHRMNQLARDLKKNAFMSPGRFSVRAVNRSPTRRVNELTRVPLLVFHGH